MRRFEDAMFEQAQQIRWLESDAGKRFTAAFEESMRTPEYGSDRFHELPKGIVWHLLHETMLQADPIYVSDDVVEMVDFAIETFTPEVVLPNDPFTMAGFCYLARPIKITDVRDVPMLIKAITWLPIHGDRLANGDTTAPNYREFVQGNRDTPPAGMWVNYLVGDDDEQGKAIKRGFPTARLTTIQTFYLPFNVRAWEAVDDDRYAKVMNRQWSLIQVLWRLGQQVTRIPQKAPRGARRDFARVRRPVEDVTVITLRRSSDSIFDFADETGRDANYRFRFLVRGHWRNQWYPSLGQHRQIWINPYVKGPDDKPLHLTERVFDFVR